VHKTWSIHFLPSEKSHSLKFFSISDQAQEVRKRRKQMYEKRMKKYAKNDAEQTGADAKGASAEGWEKASRKPGNSRPRAEQDRSAEGKLGRLILIENILTWTPFP